MKISAAATLLGGLLAASTALADTAFSLEAWSAKDHAFKIALVTGLIRLALEDHITIRRPAEYYVTELDSLVANSINNKATEGLKGSVGISFKTIAMMDCDWDDGSDPLVAAEKYFGPENLSNVKRLYPEKYERLRNGCK